jgi:aminodeoxyfutalosine synthase
MHIKAFTAVEIIDIAQKMDASVLETLTELKKVGLSALPGGGAEILAEEYFRENCPQKPNPDQWLAVHTAAHRLGLVSNATMLYGFRERPEQRIEHLMKLRNLQDESIKQGKGRFLSFVPLPYIPPDKNSDRRTNALLALKTIAVSRLILDKVPYIKAFWPMLGVKLAQVALSFGANDLDGTVQQYRIVEKTSENQRDNLTVEEIKALIIEADGIPVQRDGLYREIKTGEMV